MKYHEQREYQCDNMHQMRIKHLLLAGYTRHVVPVITIMYKGEGVYFPQRHNKTLNNDRSTSNWCTVHSCGGNCIVILTVYLQYPKNVVHKNSKQQRYTSVTHGVEDGRIGNIKHY
jgi:hypothetical protein